MSILRKTNGLVMRAGITKIKSFLRCNAFGRIQLDIFLAIKSAIHELSIIKSY